VSSEADITVRSPRTLRVVPGVRSTSVADWASLVAPVPDELARRYVAEGLWVDQSLGEFLLERLARDAALPARVWSRTRPHLGTLGELALLSRRVAGGLASLGVRAGDVVAVWLPNWIEAAASFYGAALLGAVVAPVVHFYGPKELQFILEQSQAKVLVAAARFGARNYLEELHVLVPAASALEALVVVDGSEQRGWSRIGRGQHRGLRALSFEELAAAAPLDAPASVALDAPALLAYTSGTTQDPKGVLHSHRTIVAEVRQLARMQADRERPLLVGAPVGHGIGMLSALLVPRELGHPLNMIDVWDPQAVLDAMVEGDLSAGSGSTYFLTSLLDAPGFGPEHLARMRQIGLGGSPVPDAVAERAEQLGISVVRSYGSTEHPSTTGSSHDAPRAKRLHTDGRPLAGVEVRIVDDDGRTLGAGETGEVLSRGPDRFVGYTDPALTDEALDREGWFATGDVGVLDEDGYLTITDRKKDVIVRGGEKVSAAEVEGVIQRIPEVAEVAVVAAPDPRLGEHGCAFVRLRPGARSLSLEDLREHLARSGMAKQKWPEELRVVEELPRTPSGKVKKFELRAMLRAEQR
jgi:acyl-CoA synthetase